MQNPQSFLKMYKVLYIIILFVSFITSKNNNKLKISKKNLKEFSNSNQITTTNPNTSTPNTPVILTDAEKETAFNYQKNNTQIFYALEQTKVARNLFYSPNKFCTDELQKAAKNLHNITATCLLKDPAHFTWTNTFRVLSAGTIGQLYPTKSPAEKVAALIESLLKLSNQDKNITANDRIAAMSFMGDLGTSLSDSQNPSKKLKDEEKIQFSFVRSCFDEFLKNQKHTPINNEKLKAFLKVKEGLFYAPGKKQQRKNLFPLESRKGILKQGEAADFILKKKLPSVSTSPIVAANWPNQLISKRRMNTLEPWAGHMTGSLPEILLVFDLLVGEDFSLSVNNFNTTILNTPVRRCRAALASGMLIAVGFHSAMECHEASHSYLGFNIRSDILKLNPPAADADIAQIPADANGNSTKIMDELMREFIEVNVPIDDIKKFGNEDMIKLNNITAYRLEKDTNSAGFLKGNLIVIFAILSTLLF